jgi:gas vesicle protein
MRVLFSFVAGMLVGVVGALLFAPTSGEELRTQLREGARFV